MDQSSDFSQSRYKTQDSTAKYLLITALVIGSMPLTRLLSQGYLGKVQSVGHTMPPISMLFGIMLEGFTASLLAILPWAWGVFLLMAMAKKCIIRMRKQQ